MRNGFRLFLMGAFGLALCVLTARAADDPKPKGDDDKSVPKTFDTQDGVQLEGTFWAADPQAPAKPKDATVLLLHNIDKAKGGDSHQDNWDNLAKKLSDQGFSVLSFDFRGFGKSHAVNKDLFWDPVKGKYNRLYVKGGNRNPPPDTIDHSDFDNNAGEYYPFLVNDIAAAKSFLDRHTGEGGVNSSNLIVVGAGEGATLGAMWMASQWHLRKLSGIDPTTLRPTYDEPEGRDEAGAVWLSISPKLGGHEAPSMVRNWLADADGENKVPMAFLFGADDSSAEAFAKSAVREVGARYHRFNPNAKEEDLRAWVKFNAAVDPVEKTNLTGSKLLGVDGTADAVVNYAKNVMESPARGVKEARSHTLQREDLFYWTFPNRPKLEAKSGIDTTIRMIPVKEFLMASGG